MIEVSYWDSGWEGTKLLPKGKINNTVDKYREGLPCGTFIRTVDLTGRQFLFKISSFNTVVNLSVVKGGSCISVWASTQPCPTRPAFISTMEDILTLRYNRKMLYSEAESDKYFASKQASYCWYIFS